MDPLNENSHPIWQAVDDALSTLPMQTPPSDMTLSIMKMLPPHPTAQPSAAPHFQLFSWFDITISFFLSMMFGLLLLLIAGWLFPPQMMPALGWLLQIISYPTIGIPLLIASIFTLVFLTLTARLLLTSHHRFVRMI